MPSHGQVSPCAAATSAVLRSRGPRRRRSPPTVTAAPSVRFAATSSATEPPRSKPITPMRSASMSWSASQPNAVSVSPSICVGVEPLDLFADRVVVAVELVGAVAVVEVRRDGEPPVAGEAVHQAADGVGDAARLVEHDDAAADRT